MAEHDNDDGDDEGEGDTSGPMAGDDFPADDARDNEESKVVDVEFVDDGVPILLIIVMPPSVLISL